MEKKKQFFGMLCALAANIIFGFSFIFSKMALAAAHPLIILSCRFTLAFLIMNILVLSGAIKVNFKGKNLKKLLLMSFAQPLCYFLFELYGLKMVSSALSGIIISLVPVGVIIYSAVFGREKPSPLQFLCTAVSLIGVTVISIISDNGAKNKLLGIIFLSVAVISAVAFNLLSRNISSEFTPFERTYFMFFIAFIGFNLITVLFLGKNYPFEIMRAISSISFLTAVFYLAAVSSVSAFLLYNYSTTHISAVKSSSFSNIITVISVLAGVFILNENFKITEILLCIPVILGVLGVNISKNKKTDA
ncbi:MAG: DMT family transporter [Clostridia bacterium]|nr:DMT family transporter [Clostridia bacterium]